MSPDRSESRSEGTRTVRPPGWEPEILAFCCSYCASAAAGEAGAVRLRYPAGTRILSTPCTGGIEMEHLLEAFEKGVDGVLVVGCPDGGCHFVEGNQRALRRLERVRAILDEIGLGGGRLRMVQLSDSMAPAFADHMREITETIRAMGPNPLKPARKESAGRS
ncbi:MAG: hydrogenase iron-sulfur subunit [Acidobacteria bacterium]|nr:hydrogenase iron-sulfur subunit [Acidobacteriota bacterium]